MRSEIRQKAFLLEVDKSFYDLKIPELGDAKAPNHKYCSIPNSKRLKRVSAAGREAKEMRSLQGPAVEGIFIAYVDGGLPRTRSVKASD